MPLVMYSYVHYTPNRKYESQQPSTVAPTATERRAVVSLTYYSPHARLPRFFDNLKIPNRG